MPSFYIEFKNDTDELILEFELIDNSTALKWFKELQEQLIRNSKLRENNRLYHFSNTTWSLENIISELNNRINIINDYKYYIPYKVDSNVNQNLLNILHKYFEEMRGESSLPKPYFLNAPVEIRKAIEDYNVLIHKAEDKLNAKQARPRIVLTFQDRIRHLLEDSDYDNFSLDISFGQVFVNYCEVGKPLWDVFKDRDSIVGAENIRPLKWYSADMNIYFIDGSLKPLMPKFWKWFDDNEKFLNNLGFFKYDKKLAIGRIPVAKLKTTLANYEIIEVISKFNTINRVYI